MVNANPTHWIDQWMGILNCFGNYADLDFSKVLFCTGEFWGSLGTWLLWSFLSCAQFWFDKWFYFNLIGHGELGRCSLWNHWDPTGITAGAVDLNTCTGPLQHEDPSTIRLLMWQMAFSRKPGRNFLPFCGLIWEAVCHCLHCSLLK